MEFIQVIVVIAIIGYAVYNNLQKEKARASKRNLGKPSPIPPAEASVPAYEDEADTADTAHTPHTPIQPISGLYKATATPPPPPARPASTPSHRPVPTSSATSTSHNNDDIRMHTAEEARRAFIYSEIFNRKY